MVNCIYCPQCLKPNHRGFAMYNIQPTSKCWNCGLPFTWDDPNLVVPFWEHVKRLWVWFWGCVCLALWVGCHGPTEVPPLEVRARARVCLVDAKTPDGCCLVDGVLDCPDVKPERVE